MCFELVTVHFFDLRTILVKLVSQAGTGFSFHHKRSQLREKLSLLHYDPIGKAQRSDITAAHVLRTFCLLFK